MLFILLFNSYLKDNKYGNSKPLKNILKHDSIKKPHKVYLASWFN
jgi:hypothetical protein